MRGLLFLSLQHARHHRGQTAVLVLCLALTIFLPAGTHYLVSDYQRELLARAEATPMVAGAKGNRFDLTLAALYFRQTNLEPIAFGEVARLTSEDVGVVVPLNVRFTARGHAIVATSPEYYEQRGVVVARGELPLVIGDATVGATVAAELRLEPGDALFSDQRELYDISKPPALRLNVAGVLAMSGTPDDDAVFVDTKTAWILEGLAHGHGDAERQVDESLVLGRSGDNVMLSPALIEFNQVTPENVATFHYHGDDSKLPLTAILVFPKDAKAGTLAKARTNTGERWQMLVPTAVIADLMGFVFRIKTFLDSFSGVLAATTALLSGLVVLLSTRLRAGEIMTLHRIGCSRTTVARLLGIEIGLVLACAAALALCAIALARTLVPDLVSMLT